ncbi:MAG: hypothetical protein ACI4JY_01545 [Oscillospiraceae bacterium]
MRKTKLAASVLAVSLAATTLLTGCKPGETSGNSGTSGNNSGTSGDSNTPAASAVELKYAAGTTLRMATGYNNSKTGLFFDGSVIGDKYEKVQEKDKDGNLVFNDDGTPKMVDDTSKVAEAGKLTLADGKTYVTGDLKPTWVEVQNQLNVKFENKYQGKAAKDEWEYWKAQLDQVDFVSGTASLLTENGPDMLVNIANYLDGMPNFKAYLEANPIVRLSITGSTTGTNKGAIYFSPYFDGVDDIERMPLMRTDWVEKLLNGEGEFTAEKSGTTAAPVYTPYMPTSGSVKIEVVKADGSATEEITKNYDAYGNIIDKMNASMSGVEAVNMLREYIDKTYDGYYGTNRADLFIGQNAAWDADELVALLRCVVANAQTLNGTDTIYGLFSREDDNTQRRVDMMRFAGILFGVRGLESRQDYFYIGTDGNLHDARTETATYEAMERMNAMAQEGLLSKSFIEASAEKTQTMLENDLGFMHYDYNQTQTIYNETALQEGEKYMAVMVPVAKWDDGDSSTPDYFRFTESWRSVKTDGWGISKAGVGLTTDKKISTQEEFDALPDKLKACLKLIDFAYSEEGQILMSYGPEAFRKAGETFNFNGKEMPVIADATYDELWKLQKGNYTNYARYYLGSTLSFVKSQAFEYQCTHAVGKEGAGKISKAIALGTIKHPLLDVAENPWWTSVPTVLPNTKMENDQIATLTELTSSGKFSTSKGKQNLFVDMIVKGYSGEGTSSRDEMIKTVSDTWKCATYVELKNAAWQRLVTYYNELNKA